MKTIQYLVLILGIVVLHVSIGTAQSPFTHTANSSNISGHMTTINNGATTGKPNALLFVTQVYNGKYNNHPYGVWYSGGKWLIYNENKKTMDKGATFNVLTVPPRANAFMHKSSSSNTSKHMTTINHPSCNGKPNVVLLVTQNWKGTYNPKSIAVWYNGSKWVIYNQDKSAMPAGANFNVMALGTGSLPNISGGKAMVFTATASAKKNSYGQHLANVPLKGGRLFVTQNYGKNGPYNPHETAVWNNGKNWTVYNKDKAALPVNAKFNILAIGATKATIKGGGSTTVTPPKTEGFHIYFASDSQYPWTANTDAGSKESETVKKQESEKLNNNHIKSMNARTTQLGKSNVKGLIINGDLTAFGHGWQLDKFKSMYAKVSVPMYLGLGNHDYANNVDDCWENNCANRMMNYIRDHIKSKRYSNFDYKEREFYKLPNLVKEHTGSYSYSWDVGNVHFVQLHNFPTYHRTWSSYVAGKAKRYTYDIKASLNWLANDLSKARKAGKAIILNFHDSDQHWTDNYSASQQRDNSNEFNKILTDYQVSAVFVGHYHSSWGKNRLTRSLPNYGSVPIFYCGSASQSKYLSVHFKNDKMVVTKVSSSNGNVTTYTDGTYTLHTPKKTVTPPKKDGYVTVFNESGYVAKFTITYKVNGKTTTKKTGDMALGNKKTYSIPGKATNVTVKAEGSTVFSWTTIFTKSYSGPPNKCFKVYATIFSPQWNNDCK